MPLVRMDGEDQLGFTILKGAVSFGAVSGEDYPFTERNNQSLLVQIAGLEIHGVDERYSRRIRGLRSWRRKNSSG